MSELEKFRARLKHYLPDMGIIGTDKAPVIASAINRYSKGDKTTRRVIMLEILVWDKPEVKGYPR